MKIIIIVLVNIEIACFSSVWVFSDSQEQVWSDWCRTPSSHNVYICIIQTTWRKTVNLAGAALSQQPT